MTAAIAPHRGSLGIIEPMRATRALVGRTAELERAVTALGLTEDAGGVLVLSGDAGIGKTRLLREVAGHAERAGWSLAVGHCVAEAGADLPYLPFAELITSLRDRVPDLIDELTGSHPALAHLLAGNPGRDRVRASTGPALLAEAVHAALTSAATRHGVLAVIEDAHWADHSSRDLLTLLMTRGFSGPVGLVVSYRSDDLHRRHPLHATLGVWARLSEVTRLHLDPLPDPTMADLVHDLTDADEDAVARIVERAAGNPFFAEELVASGNELGTDLGRVLRTRFEQLDAGTRTVVRAAAVMGRPLDHDLLQAVVDLSRTTWTPPWPARSTSTSWNALAGTPTGSGTRWSRRPSGTTCCPANGGGCTPPSPRRCARTRRCAPRPIWPGTPRRAVTWRPR